MKHAVVTGASSGIGAATALQLANAGFHVYACARRTDRLADLAAQHERISAVELDVTSDSSVAELVVEIGEEPLHVLVANAGGAFDANSIVDAEIARWQHSFDVNVLGTLRTVKALHSALLRSGDGHIIVTTSTAAQVVYESGGSYTAAKHAEHALVATLRLELAGESIRVTEIAPGMVQTPEFALNRFDGDSGKAAKVYEGVEYPLTAGDVADTIVWSATRPAHVNIDLLVVRPLAQAAQHKVIRRG